MVYFRKRKILPQGLPVPSELLSTVLLEKILLQKLRALNLQSQQSATL